ncbi:large subunit ribosomal protein L3e [Nematocida homosporus]|uniref:large subunit ribosomal protein L3e n=1 Tax=Nematocida homosporus TaxID=1912981 RepID=UPI0022208172|nr:large subunit ribosomal protein L3e [Nematocida homosporus]KAI5184743.1 large subunit ribosomal protein L3e [Nematocida homosporus]
MSHRKYEAPRHGSLAFLPRKRARTIRPKIPSYPADDETMPVHLTTYFAYKAGMTHVLRLGEREGSKLSKCEIVDPVTILETPPCVVFGLVGYKKTPQGNVIVHTVLAEHIDESVKRRYYKRYYRSQKTALSQYPLKYKNGVIDQQIQAIRDNADIIRVLIHSQVTKIKGLNCRKAHIMESQLNGGSVQDKIDFALSHFEKEVPVGTFCAEEDQEMIDVIGVTKGKGFQGCTKRWGTTILPRKTNKGLRKVACIGAWHPSRVMYSVARAGQTGFHHRVAQNLRVYKVGNGQDETVCQTPYDLTQKTINPMGGFTGYGQVVNDFVMVKGSVMGPRKRVLVMRKVIGRRMKGKNAEKITLKFIDTASKIGGGRFQTSAEKQEFYGKLKSQLVAETQNE